MRFSAILVAVPVWLFALAVLTGTALRAQVFELSGGTSSLSQADGGRLTVRGENYTGSFGLGTVDGQLMGGAQLTRSLPGARLSVGSITIPFNLPTDIFDNNHFVTGLGAEVQARPGGLDLEAFGGATADVDDSPFFDASRVDRPAAALRLHAPLSGGWSVSGEALVAQRLTALESIEWTEKNDTHDARHALHLAVSAGLGEGHGYAAASLVASRPSFDFKGSYVVAAPEFRRTELPLALTVEPDRENLSLVLRPSRHLTVTLARQNFLTPPPDAEAGTAVRSTVNQVGADARLGSVSLSATGFESHYNGNGDLALSLVATRDFGPRLRVQTTYLASRPRSVGVASSGLEASAPGTQALVVNVQRELTSRWSVSAAVNRSNGQESVSFGGAFLSNLVTLSADYQTFYVAANPADPFEQVLLLSADLHLWGNLTLHGGSFVAPNGKVMYSTGADATASRNRPAAATAERNPMMGNMVLDGRVLDRAGHPVGGAALLIDERPVYTNSRGYFLIREKKMHTHALEILGDRFLDGYAYRVVSAPAQSRSGQPRESQSGESQPVVTVVVERVAPQWTHGT